MKREGAYELVNMTGEHTIQAKGVVIPRHIHLSEVKGNLEFEYAWFKYKYVAAIILAPVLSWFLVTSRYIEGSFSEPTMGVAVIVAICLFVMYYALAKIFNSTRIIVTSDQIRVIHGPLPMLKNLLIKKEDVAQLYVTRQDVFHYYYRIFPTYQVNVILKNRQVITLVSKLDTPAQGRFIEQKIEQFFNIEDVPVEGEIDKSKDPGKK